MKKNKKIIILIFIVVLALIVLYSYREKTNRIKMDDETIKIIEVNIIDKNNKIEQLHKDAEKEEYVIVDIMIDGNYYSDVGIRTKGSSIYTILERYGSDRYSYKVKLNYTNKEQNYKRNERTIFEYKCFR